MPGTQQQDECSDQNDMGTVHSDWPGFALAGQPRRLSKLAQTASGNERTSSQQRSTPRNGVAKIRGIKRESAVDGQEVRVFD